jgi:hypothetical protein
MSERLTEIISHMLHTGVNARRTLTRGLIIIYATPSPVTSFYELTAARLSYWPDDQEIKIVYDCLYRAWRHHPKDLVYDITDWTKHQLPTPNGEGIMGAFSIHWCQWPIRDIFSAPSGLQDSLKAALARR